MKSTLASKDGTLIATIPTQCYWVLGCEQLSKICEADKKMPRDDEHHDRLAGATNLASDPEQVIGLLAPLKPHVHKDVPLATDLMLFRRAVAAVIGASESGMLTEAQANEIIKRMCGQLLGRCVGNIFTGIFEQEAKSRWFVAASRKSYAY